MGFEQQSRLGYNGLFVIAVMRAVGGANLPDNGATFGHDVRDTKRTSDFDQLTT